ncbi:DUF2442 domain-containing protein [Caulobacter sp.]|uniref:DUF6998 domain-containing protein n=1 Tax=Caulobacter sp. TaxID=78 RepID=UPI001B238EBD|nr:DUF2442 domain-containing protein [Caulobacter sp.]MBO9547694.1 DUF2442 domain-containing protein [Caulobacter sp.]
MAANTDLPAAFKFVRAVSIKALQGYRLNVAFSDGSSGICDFSKTVMSSAEMVQPLRDEGFFSRVFLEAGAPTWPNGYDVDPSNMRIGLVQSGLLRGGNEPLLIRLPSPVAAIFKAVEDLEKLYPGRKFTPDGHLVGSIGEVIAAEALSLVLHPASHPSHDAHDPRTGRDVQIKLTGGKSVSLYDTCDRLVVLRVRDAEHAEVVYDGDGHPAWEAAGAKQKNGQRRISIAKLKRLIT